MLVVLMKILKERINIFTVIISVTILISCLSFRNSDDKDSFVLKEVVNQLKDNHYAARPIDDTFSKHIFKQFINTLDFNRLFFTQKDINKLNKHTLLIDNQITNGDFSFYDETILVINERIANCEQLYIDILSKPFDFDKNDVYETEPCKAKANKNNDLVAENNCFLEGYAKNNKELKEKWRLFLKYQVLSKLYKNNKIQEQKKEDQDSSYVHKTFAQLEEESRKEVLKGNNDWFNRLKQLTDKDRFSQYVNAITESYDPHTTYYPPKDKENFDIRMSGRLEGIGATLQEKDGYIKVTRIVPGSPSWKQGELQEEDLILKVAQGSLEAVDIVGMRLDEAVQLIRGKKGTEVRLTVKKVDGTITIIPIIRDIVILEETYARSNVILIDQKKYGYIKLPQFYADFSGKGGRNCSDDVKNELEKLKKEDITGIILDLRNNGGGALSEVVKMTGLFIESGPIVQVKAKHGAPYVLRDNDESITYNGDLVVLVNSFSASASEILAAAIQDYRRGVIVGSASTHGKGTVQRVLDIDRVVRGHQDIKPLGAMKLTTQKFYRVNGGATQLKGVTPDIIIPDRYSYLDLGEKELEFALEWDKIAPSNFEKLTGYVNNISDIKSLSTKRIQSDTIFQKYNDYANYLKTQSDVTAYSLNYKKYSDKLEQNKAFTNEYNKTIKKIKPLDVYTSSSDKMAIDSDSSKQSGFDSFNKTVSKDYYLIEAIEVLNDIKKNK